MPLTLLTPLLMQLSGPLAFIISAGLAGLLNRSLMLVPLLALTATSVSVLMRILIPSMRAELQTVLQPDAPVIKVPATAGNARLLFALARLRIVFFTTPSCSALSSDRI